MHPGPFPGLASCPWYTVCIGPCSLGLAPGHPGSLCHRDLTGTPHTHAPGLHGGWPPRAAGLRPPHVCWTQGSTAPRRPGALPGVRSSVTGGTNGRRCSPGDLPRTRHFDRQICPTAGGPGTRQTDGQKVDGQTSSWWQAEAAENQRKLGQAAGGWPGRSWKSSLPVFPTKDLCPTRKATGQRHRTRLFRKQGCSPFLLYTITAAPDAPSCRLSRPHRGRQSARGRLSRARQLPCQHGDHSLPAC